MFFVVGRAKSGTTWLMDLLEACPSITCLGEGRFFGGGDSAQFGPQSLSRILGASPELRKWLSESAWTRHDDPAARLDAVLGSIVGGLMGERLARSGAEMVGDKTPLLSTSAVAEIGRACPGARVVHILRDGRDVAVSSIHHVWNRSASPRGMELSAEQAATRDAYRADPEAFVAAGRSLFTLGELHKVAEGWAETVSAARRQGRELGDSMYAEVRYEDLIADGPGELDRVLAFLGVDAGEEAIAASLEQASFARASGGRRPGDEDSTAFLRKGVAGDWRNVFTDANRDVFKRVAGEALVEFGYETGTDW